VSADLSIHHDSLITGYVSGPVVEYLSRSGKNSIVVGSVALGEAQKLVETWSKAGRAHLSAVRVDAANTGAWALSAYRCMYDICCVLTLVLSLDCCTGELSALVKAADVVVSLLPATMHPPIAELCLQHQKHLVTASYVSPGTSRTMTGYRATCLLARCPSVI